MLFARACSALLTASRDFVTISAAAAAAAAPLTALTLFSVRSVTVYQLYIYKTVAITPSCMKTRTGAAY